MLSVLLETMHEDCNSVSKKPYVEQKDSNGRPDEVIAAEFWSGFKEREKSIFIDLFYGQLKSQVMCSVCRNLSVTFDPFNVLSVPIPKQSLQPSITISYYQLSFTQPVLKIKLNLTSEHAKIKEIKNKLTEAIHKHLVAEGQSIELERVSPPIVCTAKDRRVVAMARNDMLLSDLEKQYHLVAVEREVYEGQEVSELCPVELVIMQPKRSYYIFNEQKPLT